MEAPAGVSVATGWRVNVNEGMADRAVPAVVQPLLFGFLDSSGLDEGSGPVVERRNASIRVDGVVSEVTAVIVEGGKRPWSSSGGVPKCGSPVIKGSESAITSTRVIRECCCPVVE